MPLARRDLVAVPAALVAGIAAAWVMLADDVQPAARDDVAFTLAVGWSLVGSGLVAVSRPPVRRLGWVMVATGFLWFASALTWAHTSALFTLGTALEVAYVLGFGYFLTTFPSGRAEGRAARAIVAAGFTLVVPVQLLWMLFGRGDEGGCPSCPENLLEVTRQETLSLAIVRVQQVAGAAVAAATVALLVHRWRAATAPQRFALGPVLLAGAAAWTVLFVWAVNDALDEPLGTAPDVLVKVVLVAVPVAFLVGLLRTRLARAGVADLVVALGAAPAPGTLRDALARALHDPTLAVAYWLPASERYVDVDGRPVSLDAPGRAATLVERDGERIAALVHDPALNDDPALVDAVSAAAALALENERLQAELRAHVEELRASRARVVHAAETERRRIERNLHDGTQQRLVSVAMALGLAESKLDADAATVGPVLREARDGLTAALAELRELSQGIHPGVLTERGLPTAVSELIGRGRMPVALEVALDGRPPEQVEAAAYYVVAESLANVAKHARPGATARVRLAERAGELVVEVSDDGGGGADPRAGSGLRGLADRVEALGGRLSVESDGVGTTVRAVIPCA